MISRTAPIVAVLLCAYAQVKLTPEQVRAGGRFTMRNAGTLYADKPILLLSLERPAR